MSDTLAPLARKNDLVTRKIEDEILVYDLVTNRAFCLNETSAAIWQICDGQNSISAIILDLQSKFGPSIDEDFVFLALEQFRKDNLIENESGFARIFKGVSRRDMIRKVGLTSLVVLPIVSSVVAPKAITAQSGCPDPNNNTNSGPNGCGCSGVNDCVSNCCGFSAAPGNICVSTGSVPVSSSCRAACECSSGCCGFGFVCVTNNGAVTGAACRVNCDCQNSCSSGTCT